jgi:hypothetical protein
MNSSNLSVAQKPAINFGVLFILAFALIVGTRPVRTDEPGSDESVTQSDPVCGSGGPCRGGVRDVVLRGQLAGVPAAA